MREAIVEFRKRNKSKYYYAITRCAFNFILAIVTYPRLFLARRKVSHIVGRKKFKKIRKIGFSTFPIFVTQAIHLYAGGSSLSKILLVCRVKPKLYSPRAKVDIVMDWQELTKSCIRTDEYIKKCYSQSLLSEKFTVNAVINSACNDISKRRMSQLNEEVLGVELDVNPLEYKGLVVRKSDINGTHDGDIIECPIPKSEVIPQFVYSRLVNNVEDGEAVDFRLIYVDGLVEIFYEKRRAISDRFSNTNTSVGLRELSSEFSVLEIAKVEEFCRGLGADYGELDVLRDRRNGQLYIVDFANTPSGPPNGLSRKDRVRSIEVMSIAFIFKVLSR